LAVVIVDAEYYSIAEAELIYVGLRAQPALVYGGVWPAGFYWSAFFFVE
jgi:hypothetical protein